MATENRGSTLLPKVGEFDLWTRAIKFDRVIVAATSSDGDEDVIAGATGTEAFTLWDVAAGTYVESIFCSVDTAWNASVTLEVGDTTDIDGWLDTLQVAATSTSDALIFSTGSADTAETPFYQHQGGKYYQSTGLIELDVSGATATVGRAVFFIKYSQLSS